MSRLSLFRSAMLVLLAASLAAPAGAQTSLPELDRRVGVLERDMRAVRRLVLPGGQVVEPEVDTGIAAPPPSAAAGSAGAPLGALTERVDALERQQRRLTAQVEEQDFKLRQLERSLAELRAGQARLESALAPPSDAPAAGTTGQGAAPLPPLQGEAGRGASRPGAAARPPAGSSGAASGTAPRSSGQAPGNAVRSPAPVAGPGPAPAPAQSTGSAAAPAAATPDARFAAALALVEARDWPGAEAAMAGFAAANPRHTQASLARYWAGRAQHNQGKFEAAARTHFDNYQANQRGSHAQHSLYWVGQALVRLNRAPEACQVYTLAQRVYADDMLAELRPQFATARRNAGCAA